MRIAVYRCVCVALLLSAACGSSVPTAPTAVPQPVAVALQPPAAPFPPLTGSSRTFNFERELSYRVHDYTTKSQVILYDNGAFVLRFDGIGAYRGAYSQAGGALAFAWEGWSPAGVWQASGTLDKESLAVRYNDIMRMTDFEDAVYVLTP